VLPLVGSMITVSGLISPCFSASVIMLRHMRSLTLPPGFRDSSLATTVHFRSRVSLFKRIRGVFPMVSKTELKISFMKVHQSLYNVVIMTWSAINTYCSKLI